jgi:hypothetical protein
MGEPTDFLLYGTTGAVTGVGKSPDGTIPTSAILPAGLSAIACTPTQAAAWAGSIVNNGTIVAG